MIDVVIGRVKSLNEFSVFSKRLYSNYLLNIPDGRMSENIVF